MEVCHVCEEREGTIECVECGDIVCQSEDCLSEQYENLCLICEDEFLGAIEDAEDTITRITNLYWH